MEQTSEVFSGRAEVISDLLGVLLAINAVTYAEQLGNGLVRTDIELGYLHPGMPSGEVMFELQFHKPVSMEWLRQRVREAPEIAAPRGMIIEPHVLLQTLRVGAKANNSMERDYGLH